MKRLLALLAIGSAFAAANASADSFVVVSEGSASAAAPLPNAPGAVVVPAAGTSAFGQPATFAQLSSLWHRAGSAFGVPWEVLAAINKVESDFGRNPGPSSAGAIGPMQFMPETWARWGLDANGDGIADPWNASDAVFAAARYLAAAGGTTDLPRAVFAYNHAQWYVDDVLSLARSYGMGGVFERGALGTASAPVARETEDVARARAALAAATALERRLAHRQRVAGAHVARAALLSGRLAWEQRAALLAARVAAAGARAREAERALEQAERQLEAASAASTLSSLFDPSSAETGVSPGVSHVFPVGGGPGLVSVSQTHHDYPAADIAAPEGSPVYALAPGTVVSAWHSPSGRCGIGFTFRSADGYTWTYCHLSYLGASVVAGLTLGAGEQVGLVGHTGHATGPHLHLQLDPTTAWPQRQPWFAAFAGVAFRWQDSGAGSSSEAGTGTGPRFEVVHPATGTWIVEGDGK